MTMIQKLFGGVALLSVAVGSVAYGANLRDNEGVTNDLVIAGIVRDIDDNCAELSARGLRGKAYLLSIYNKARAAGFSRAEIEAFVDNEDEEARLQRRVDAWFAANGATKDNVETFCAVGRSQIAAENQIGVLLRAN